MVMFHTGHLLHSPERVCLNSCPKWKHLEGSLRTTTEGLLENSLSASWNKTSCYLNHQWGSEDTRLHGCFTLDRRVGPMPPCRLSESSSDADPTRLPLICVGTEVHIILDLYYIYSLCSGLPRWCSSKEFSYKCRKHKKCGFSP